jgi:hypothetical protein
MNGFMAIVGYCVIILVALLALAIAVGRFFDHKPDADPEDWDPAPRQLKPHVPQPWQPTGDALNDPREDPRDASPE